MWSGVSGLKQRAVGPHPVFRLCRASLTLRWWNVAVHLWVVVPDVPLCAAVRDRPEAERRGEVVGPLELRRGRGGDAVTVRSKRRGGGRWGGEEEEEEEERKQ